jgi:hypothetical protein
LHSRQRRAIAITVSEILPAFALMRINPGYSRGRASGSPSPDGPFSFDREVGWRK